MPEQEPTSSDSERAIPAPAEPEPFFSIDSILDEAEKLLHSAPNTALSILREGWTTDRPELARTYIRSLVEIEIGKFILDHDDADAEFSSRTYGISVMEYASWIYDQYRDLCDLKEALDLSPNRLARLNAVIEKLIPILEVSIGFAIFKLFEFSAEQLTSVVSNRPFQFILDSEIFHNFLEMNSELEKLFPLLKDILRKIDSIDAQYLKDVSLIDYVEEISLEDTPTFFKTFIFDCCRILISKVDEEFERTSLLEQLSGLEEGRLSEERESWIKGSLEAAKELIGEGNFYGPKALKNAFNIDIPLSKIPPIPFLSTELENARKLNHALILRHRRKGTDGTPSLTWWVLVSKDFLCVNKNILQETQCLADYLRNKVFQGQLIPEPYAEALREFDDRKAEIEVLHSSGGGEMSYKELYELQLNKLCRRDSWGAWFDETVVRTNNGGRFLHGEECERTGIPPSFYDDHEAVSYGDDSRKIMVHTWKPWQYFRIPPLTVRFCRSC